MDEVARDSISAWGEKAALGNLAPPRNLDMTRADWHEQINGPLDAVLAINLVHVAPWEVTLGLLRGAGELLVQGGKLYLYGPYRVDGVHTAKSNIKFERWLKDQNESWGVRDMGEVERAAEPCGFLMTEAVEMPANNFSLIFRKA